MKTKYWVVLLAAILILCTGLSIPLLFPGEDAAFAEIISDGHLIETVSLKIDREILITTADGGTNTVI